MSAEPTDSTTPPAADAGDLLDTAVEVEPAAPASPPAGDAAGDAGARLASLEAQLAKAEAGRKENWEKFLRAAADLENLRRRTRRDLDDARADSRTRILKEMLPVVDNLERGLQHAEESAASGDLTAIVDGVRLVLRQFSQALERCEVRPVDALGHPFDPNVHEAISQAESAERSPGTVLQVLQRGYHLGDRLLRPALVVVAKAPASGGEPERG
jgi:molecular chaperone GrpE